jgi:4-amino-4-deoxy-L-arabinose transferase-like glycosyltransferase
VVPSWLVFEAAPTKLPHYTLPLYPALMLLAAWWLTMPRPAGRWWPHAARALTVLSGFLLAAGAVAVPVVLHGPWWLGVPGLLAAGLVTWFAVQATPQGAVRAALAAVPLYAALLWLLLPGLDALWISPRAVAALAAPGMPAGRFGAVGFHEPSLRFLGGTDAAFLATAQDGAAALASRQVVAVLVSDRDRAAFAAAAAGLGLPVHLAGSVSGFNYSRGRWVTLDVVDRP